ncbi:MAG: methionyl aminopeptidase [Parachlamydiaceae bacterium]|nr:methionyl aminopeptidase [Parachlamydiaceae bacterium]
MIGRNDECWCGSQKKWKKCHFPQLPSSEKKLPSLDLKKEYFRKYQILIKDEEQINKIRASCQLASKILDAVCKKAQKGVTTLELNDYAHKLHLEAGAIPAPLHYGSPPFPKSICTSLNEVICHGIPNDIPLMDGDIVNIDVTCILDGYYGDNSRMVTIGEISKERQLVVDVSYECLMRSIEILRPGVPVSKIGDVIEDYASSKGCSVVHQFVGHGVGVDFHESPQIPHCRNKSSILLVPGMTFTIEPMINAGVRDAVIDPVTKWIARTKDGRASGQWEHTILITETGHEILTPWTRNP